MLKGNKGEWSELYVLITLLADGELHQSDVNLKVDKSNIYEIVKAYKDEKNYRLEFIRQDNVVIYDIKGRLKNKIGEFELSKFQRLSQLLYHGIIAGKGKSFTIPEVSSYLKDFMVEKLKANANSKADINLRIYDHRLAKETDLGFSIKSLLGNDSTLFNTGAGNNFIYRISNPINISVVDFNKETYSPPKRISKITYRIKSLLDMGCEIKYDDIQSKQLWRNLKMIDGDLPEILGHALYYRYLYRERSVKAVADLLEELDPMNFYEGKSSKQKLYEYKIMKFLAESAMGMTSETAWLGEYDNFGGVIIAKEDGDIVCFHIYDFNLLRTYLINNTVFEQASTGEDGVLPGTPKSSGKNYHFGWLMQESDGLVLKINLQVRFK